MAFFTCEPVTHLPLAARSLLQSQLYFLNRPTSWYCLYVAHFWPTCLSLVFCKFIADAAIFLVGALLSLFSLYNGTSLNILREVLMIFLSLSRQIYWFSNRDTTASFQIPLHCYMIFPLPLDATISDANSFVKVNNKYPNNPTQDYNSQSKPSCNIVHSSCDIVRLYAIHWCLCMVCTVQRNCLCSFNNKM
jgi:hypothetical protein